MRSGLDGQTRLDQRRAGWHNQTPPDVPRGTSGLEHRAWAVGPGQSSLDRWAWTVDPEPSNAVQVRASGSTAKH
jgi:hypothetical protein